MERKQSIRKRILSERSALSDKERTQKSDRIQKKIMDTDAYKEAEVILLYIDYKGEVSTELLLEDCFRQGKKVACPRVLADGEMEFFEITGLADCEPGAYGILEPVEGLPVVVPEPEVQSIILMPGLAFDLSGARMGYGGGYYDRYLAKYPWLYTIAPVYEFSILEHLPVEAHDVPIKMLVTEKESIECRD